MVAEGQRFGHEARRLRPQVDVCRLRATTDTAADPGTHPAARQRSKSLARSHRDAAAADDAKAGRLAAKSLGKAVQAKAEAST